MYWIPGVARPLEKAARDSYANSPFVDDIALIGVPKGCEACMCKGFGSTLSGAALQWFVGLPNKSISSFADLVNAFNQQFASSRKPEKQASDLYRIVQGFEESTRDYLNRFNKEKVSIPRCDITTAIQAFRRGLHQDSQLYKDLTMHPCTTFEEVQSKAILCHEVEEDSRTVRGTYDSDPVSRKAPVEKKSERSKPYSRSVNKVSGNSEGKGEADLHLKISEYGFTTNLAGLFKALKALGRRVRWPKLPEGNPSSRDTCKKCGSELCGLTYSAAKRHATRTKGDRPKLPAGNCKVKKILVDTGSSVNLIMMETLKGMGFTEKDLAKKAIPLVGFSGETKHSLGEIITPTYAGGVNKQIATNCTLLLNRLDAILLPSSYKSKIEPHEKLNSRNKTNGHSKLMKILKLIIRISMENQFHFSEENEDVVGKLESNMDTEEGRSKGKREGKGEV
ncbi:uncharacterized protein LOC141613753 [Silene latifolia]|uniref:uncharacterized protein LOC141613753 n=1 Tax=Silene latifolia TaxID=37657 RepID=UPI003D77A37E